MTSSILCGRTVLTTPLENLPLSGSMAAGSGR